LQAEDGIRDFHVTGVQTCALPVYGPQPAHGRNDQDQEGQGAEVPSRQGPERRRQLIDDASCGARGAATLKPLVGASRGLKGFSIFGLAANGLATNKKAPDAGCLDAGGGGCYRGRTCDLRLVRAPLYQLS